MKKFGILFFVISMAITFAVPALAFITIDGDKGEKLFIGGMIFTDFGYWYRSKELIGGPGNTTLSGRTEFINQVPNYSMMHGYVSVGNAGMYWSFGMGENSNPSALLGANTSYIETRIFRGWYDFGNCRIVAGKSDGQIYSVVPWQNLGQWEGHIYGFGWGAVYDQRNAQVRFRQKITKEVEWMISLVDPDQYVDAAASPANKNSYTYLPQVDLKVMLNFGTVALYPAFAYQNVKWDNVQNGFDDNMTSWYGVLPVVVKLGGFTGTIQAGYGQNIDAFFVLQNPAVRYFRDVSGKIKNSTAINGFIDLAYAFGPATPHIYFGYDNAKNSDEFKVGDDNNTRTMYGASIDYMISPNFFVTPEFTLYDYGKVPGVASRPDIGKEWIGGVQFRFVF